MSVYAVTVRLVVHNSMRGVCSNKKKGAETKRTNFMVTPTLILTMGEN